MSQGPRAQHVGSGVSRLPRGLSTRIGWTCRSALASPFEHRSPALEQRRVETSLAHPCHLLVAPGARVSGASGSRSHASAIRPRACASDPSAPPRKRSGRRRGAAAGPRFGRSGSRSSPGLRRRLRAALRVAEPDAHRITGGGTCSDPPGPRDRSGPFAQRSSARPGRRSRSPCARASTARHPGSPLDAPHIATAPLA